MKEILSVYGINRIDFEKNKISKCLTFSTNIIDYSLHFQLIIIIINFIKIQN